MEQVTININGADRVINAERGWNMLYVLREVLGLTGTKCGCNSASCGACKIIVDGVAVNSCTVPALKAAGKRIETVECLSSGKELHPIQQAFIDCGAVQCGYCIPGMLMSAKALLDKNPDPTEQEIRVAIDDNLCRCTGYVKIVAAIQESAKRINSLNRIQKEEVS